MPQQARDYPSPPLAEQDQPWPAPACRMQPPPDHGETSDVGSGRLAGRNNAGRQQSLASILDIPDQHFDDAATKAAVRSMTRPLAKQLGDQAGP